MHPGISRASSQSGGDTVMPEMQLALAVGAEKDPTMVTPPSINITQQAMPKIDTAFACLVTRVFSATVIFTTSLPPN